ncbi:flavin monoamine oxidase family protein [Pseudoalteromonas citrea]|nr:NAD(P)/FAD-dependent oxidoreductase [Pseudoalteromonas citrea]
MMKNVELSYQQLNDHAKTRLNKPLFDSISEVTDIVIVGAGLSGLAAAKQLSDGNEYQFKVYEAKSRVGGRTINQALKDNRGNEHIVDGGAQWIGPTHVAMHDLIKELRLNTFLTPQVGESLQFDAPEPPLQQELNVLRAQLNQLAAHLPMRAPWLARSAKQWDEITALQWMQRAQFSPEAIQELDYSVQTFLAASISEISFFYLLFYIRSAGSIEQLEDLNNGAQDSLIKEGAQSISIELRKRINAQLNFDAVVSVDDYETFTLVTLQSGQVTLCQKVIFAMMPSLLKNIRFSPALSTEKLALIDNWNTSVGSIKAHILFNRPFWREQGLSGISFLPNEAFSSTFDCTRTNSVAGALTVFVNGSAEMRALTVTERRERILSQLSQLFGPLALEAIDYVEMDWMNEPFQQGCESPLNVNVLSNFGKVLRTPHGNVYFCGTETAEVWSGYMEGAVTAGYRAAGEVEMALNESRII